MARGAIRTPGYHIERPHTGVREPHVAFCWAEYPDDRHAERDSGMQDPAIVRYEGITSGDRRGRAANRKYRHHYGAPA
jgi:hypothetical protein